MLLLFSPENSRVVAAVAGVVGFAIFSWEKKKTKEGRMGETVSEQVAWDPSSR